MRSITRRLHDLPAPDRCLRLGNATELCAGCLAAEPSIEYLMEMIASWARECPAPAPLPPAPHRLERLSADERLAAREAAIAALPSGPLARSENPLHGNTFPPIAGSVIRPSHEGNHHE